jgi:hypothetical protein
MADVVKVRDRQRATDEKHQMTDWGGWTGDDRRRTIDGRRRTDGGDVNAEDGRITEEGRRVTSMWWTDG